MKDYSNYNYKEKDIEEYIEEIKKSVYGLELDKEKVMNVHSGYVYRIESEDVSFKDNTIILNVGNYANKKLDYLLNELFFPKYEFCFDLLKAMKSNNTKLTLINNIENQCEKFHHTINIFFKNLNIEIDKQGFWN